MTIEIDKDWDFKRVFCDNCSNEFNYDYLKDFWDVLAHIKQEGWKIYKEKGEWFHICPDCLREE